MSNTSLQYRVLLVHGSSDPNWKEPFEKLARRLSQRTPDVQWNLAYMEFQLPNLKTVCQSIEKQNPNADVTVVPLFFSNGAHVALDIPALVTEARKYCPALHLDLGKPLGALPEFWTAIEKILLDLLENQ